MTAIASTDSETDLAVETIELRKVYGSLVAVQDLNLEVPKGSIYAIIGPNGAGKSTTFHILATLLSPTSGVATIMGAGVDEDPYEVRSMIGFMPDFFGVYDDVRVSEYLDFFAGAYRLNKQYRKTTINDLLELVDLTHKADDFVESLSRGMKQRLGLARALIHDPQVLILDEPASGLDPRARIEFRELLQELQALGKTIIISSHILSELEEVCTHVGVMEAGRLLAQGAPAGLLSGAHDARVFRLKLSSTEETKKAIEVAQKQEGVISALERDDGLEVFYTGEDPAVLLKELVAAGLSVKEFLETKAGLEEIFMQITKGIVQ